MKDDPDFPTIHRINGRNYVQDDELAAYKQQLIRRSLAEPLCENGATAEIQAWQACQKPGAEPAIPATPPPWHHPANSNAVEVAS